LTVNKGGTLQLAAPAFDAVLNTAGTARGMDLQGGSVVFDYSSTGVSPVATVQANLYTSFVAGPSALKSGPFFTSTGSALGLGIGYVDNTTAKTVSAKITEYGDATLDGSVSFEDLGALLSNLGSTSATWTQGDFNYDGKVTFEDLGLLLSHLGQTAPVLDAPAGGMAGASAKVVPEPGTVSLLLAGLLGLIAYAWRKRK
jgi:hypothetical protein